MVKLDNGARIPSDPGVITPVLGCLPLALDVREKWTSISFRHRITRYFYQDFLVFHKMQSNLI